MNFIAWLYCLRSLWAFLLSCSLRDDCRLSLLWRILTKNRLSLLQRPCKIDSIFDFSLADVASFDCLLKKPCLPQFTIANPYVFFVFLLNLVPVISKSVLGQKFARIELVDLPFLSVLQFYEAGCIQKGFTVSTDSLLLFQSY